MRPPRLTAGVSISCLALIAGLLLASLAEAENPPTDLNRTAAPRGHLNVLLRYSFRDGASGENLVPAASLSGQRALWRDDSDANRIVLYGGAHLSLPGEVDGTADAATGLLLPGIVSIRSGVGYEHAGAHGVRFAGPEVSVGAKAIAWSHRAVARQVAFNGGAAVSKEKVFGLSLLVGRTVNGLGAADRGRVLAALDGPGSWTTYELTAAEVHLSPGDLWCFAEFGAFLGDSKFSVVPHGRRIFSLGIRKEL